MSWSITVDNLQSYPGFPVDIQEGFASQHPSYPRDADEALVMAKLLGLTSATLCGGRTPNPYTGEDIVDVSVRGTPATSDFLSEMRGILANGPDSESWTYKHYEALARLRANPHTHIWDVLGTSCVICGVKTNGSILYFEDDNADQSAS